MRSWLRGIVSFLVVLIVAFVALVRAEPAQPVASGADSQPTAMATYPSPSPSAPVSLHGPVPASMVATPHGTQRAAVPVAVVASGARLSNWCDSYCGDPVAFIGCPQPTEPVTATLACLAPDGTPNGTAYPVWHRPGMPFTNPPPRP